MNTEELKSEVKKISWFHTIELPGGVITPGYEETKNKLTSLALPESLLGLTVLDIGAWDGFFSFEAERRGASRVVAADLFVWNAPWAGKQGFNLARQVLGSKVEDVEIDVLDISPDRIGVFDLVLFMGVLYHMRHPLLALERAASVTGKQIIVETQVDLVEYPRPAMAFYPGNELNNDYSNWWGPNPIAVEAMLKAVGFQKVVMIDSAINATRRGFHAWK